MLRIRCGIYASFTSIGSVPLVAQSGQAFLGLGFADVGHGVYPGLPVAGFATFHHLHKSGQLLLQGMRRSF